MYNKELLKGTLSAIILHLLAEHGRMYGYEMAQKVKELSGDRILLKDGSLYPTLNKMLLEGALSCEEVHIGKRVRKYYKLTEKGQKEKSIAIQELFSFMETIQRLLGSPNATQPWALS